VEGVPAWVTLFLFLLFSTFVEFELVLVDGLETPKSEEGVTDCLFLVAFVEGDGTEVSFVDEDFLRVNVGLAACTLLTLKE